MLSSTVLCGKRLYAWKTMPIRRRTASTSTRGSVISASPSQMSPSSTCSNRLRQRSRVDLPEPEAPMRQTTSPSETSRSMPLRTSVPLKDLRTPSALSTVRSSCDQSVLAAQRPHRQVVGEPRQRDRRSDEEHRRHDVRREDEVLARDDLGGPQRLDEPDGREQRRV